MHDGPQPQCPANHSRTPMWPWQPGVRGPCHSDLHAHGRPHLGERIIVGWYSDAVSSRLSGRTGHQDARRDPAARLRGRVHRREPAARAAPPRRGRHGDRRRPAAHRHLSQSRPRPQHLRHHRRQRPPQPQEDSRGGARRRRHAGLRARHRRRRHRQARRRVPRRVSRRLVPVDVGAVRRAAAHRVQPLADARARAAVPALLQRRRPRADHAAQRSRSRRDGQRPGAAQRPAPHQDHGDHRRDPGRDAAGEPADGQPARHPRRGDHAGVAQGIRPHRDGRRAAALLRRPDRPRRPGHRPSSRAAGLHRGLQGHPRRLRIDVARSSPSTCAPSTSTSPSGRRPRCSTRSSPTRCSSTARPTASTSKRSRTSIRWPTPR